MTTRCDKCGDESNSAPGLPCGRVEEDLHTMEPLTEPCTGTYRVKVGKTYVITASVYVDEVRDAKEAADVIGLLNAMVGSHGPNSPISVQIRLPDEDSGYEWSEVGGEDPEDGQPGPGQYSMMLDPRYNKSTDTVPPEVRRQAEVDEYRGD